jgi:hypothetical protein
LFETLRDFGPAPTPAAVATASLPSGALITPAG